jgi:hypothetical protein
MPLYTTVLNSRKGVIEEGSRDRCASAHRDDAVAERGLVFSCQQRDAPLREREPVLLELIQRVEHSFDVLGHARHPAIHFRRSYRSRGPRIGTTKPR